MAEPRPLKPLKIEQVLRFWSYIDRSDPHWKWTGPIIGVKRHPAFCAESRKYSARRLAYELSKSGKPLPKTKRLWVTCGNTYCLNPEHMAFEKPKRDKCKRGHKLTEKNVYITSQGKRTCLRCLKKGLQDRRKRYALEGRGWGRDYKRKAA
jgi:hypothetical protein